MYNRLGCNILASRKLLLWFEKRRTIKTLNLAQQEITGAIDTVNELEKALTAFYDGNVEEAKTSIDRLFAQEAEIDDLRRAVLEELTESELPSDYREDLKGLVENLDRMADNVKDSARSIEILMKAMVPKEILGEYLKVARNLTGCATALGKCIEMLGVDPYNAIEYAQKVDAFEEKVDEGYVEMKTLFMTYYNTVDAAAVMELMDLIKYMERTADVCADTAESIRILATGDLRGH